MNKQEYLNDFISRNKRIENKLDREIEKRMGELVKVRDEGGIKIGSFTGFHEVILREILTYNEKYITNDDLKKELKELVELYYQDEINEDLIKLGEIVKDNMNEVERLRELHVKSESLNHVLIEELIGLGHPVFKGE